MSFCLLSSLLPCFIFSFFVYLSLSFIFYLHPFLLPFLTLPIFSSLPFPLPYFSSLSLSSPPYPSSSFLRHPFSIFLFIYLPSPISFRSFSYSPLYPLPLSFLSLPSHDRWSCYRIVKQVD